MLIRNAEVGGRCVDVRLSAGKVAAIVEQGQAPPLVPALAEPTFDASGGALLPGLHDHHIHLFGYAAASESVRCGPPQVQDAGALVEALEAASARSRGGWLRGIGYHESVAGDIDRAWLDKVLPDQPVRIQHRSGRLWILNSAALERVMHADQSPLERLAGRLTGRLYDADAWLRVQLGGQYPDIDPACAKLAQYGITGLTDASVTNDLMTLEHLSAQIGKGAISQSLLLMGGSSLSAARRGAAVEVGAFKVHLHDHALPDFAQTISLTSSAHEVGRVVAFHCVTEAELAYALGVLRTAGNISGDRIEHAGIASPEQVIAVAELGLAVVTQPHFIAERGDQYYQDVPSKEHSWLYRLAEWHRNGVALAAGSDAPYGAANPWVAMQAAVDRRAPSGRELGAGEALTPEQALDLYLSPGNTPGRNWRRVVVGADADLCVLDRPWSAARSNLAAVRVVATYCRGQCLLQGTDPNV